MLNYQARADRQITISQLCEGLQKVDLATETTEMLDIMSNLIVNCIDADVTFVPSDPKANDTYASNTDDVGIPWTLGHLIVHVTASSEEGAFLAAELARGVENHGRSRYETQWETVTTIAQCHHRLAESRRMRLTSLETWPDAPHLDNRYEIWKDGPVINAIERFVFGLSHDFSHVEQIRDVVTQAKKARAG